MKSTWSPLYRGLLPAAACGPPGKKKFGKPVRLDAEERPRTVGPVVLERETVPAADPHARQRAGAEVEAGRPHDDVELLARRRPSRSRASVMRTIGVCLRSTSETFGLLNAS